MGRPEVLAAYREKLDLLDKQNAAIAVTKKEIAEIEWEIEKEFRKHDEWAEGHGVKAPGISVNVVREWHATYEPDKWSDLVRWSVENGMTHAIQRRLNVKAILELIDSGKGIPAGLGVESVLSLSFRRS